MTCKDCIYFNSTEHLKPEWIGSNKCDKHTADGYQEYVNEDSEVCKDFEPKESLTCGDCIHFTTEHPELTEYRKCEKQTTDEYQAYVVADKKVCKDFENSWESISK